MKLNPANTVWDSDYYVRHHNSPIQRTLLRPYNRSNHVTLVPLPPLGP